MSIFFHDKSQTFEYIPDLRASIDVSLEIKNKIRSILSKIVLFYKSVCLDNSVLNNAVRRQLRKQINAEIENLKSAVCNGTDERAAKALHEINAMSSLCYKLTPSNSNADEMLQKLEMHFRSMVCALVGYDGFKYPMFDTIRHMDLFVNGPNRKDIKEIEDYLELIEIEG